jgi:hypothetical protein
MWISYGLEIFPNGEISPNLVTLTHGPSLDSTAAENGAFLRLKVHAIEILAVIYTRASMFALVLRSVTFWGKTACKKSAYLQSKKGLFIGLQNLPSLHKLGRVEISFKYVPFSNIF